MQEPKIQIKKKYWSSEDAFKYCEKIARNHYENFPVASRFVPRNIRKYVWAVYAFARIADDYADESGYTLAERIENLNQWEKFLVECYNGNPTHRVFAALAETVERFQIPIELFQNLINAFRSDVLVKRYETFDDVLNYCRNSANPVGRIMLLLFNYRNEKLMEYSDFICTGLQLANFWQDVSIDLQKDRIYIPLEDMEEFGYSVDDLFKKQINDNFRSLMAFEVQRTLDFFVTGMPLIKNVDKELSMELKLIWYGGTSILKKIHELGYDVITYRPKLNLLNKVNIFFKALLV